MVRSRTSSTDLELKYFEKVKKYSIYGEISPARRTILNTFRLQLGLPLEVAAEIEDQVVQPFRKRLENLQQYRAAFTAEIKQEFPLSQESLALLEELQEVLGLQGEHVVPIEEGVVAEILEQLHVQEIEEGLAIQDLRQKLAPIENQLIDEINSDLHPAIDWIASQRDFLIKRACREVQKENIQLSEKELDDLAFQVGQYLNLIRRAIVAQSNNLLQEPRPPLLRNISIYTKALEFVKTRIPKEMNDTAKAELESRLDFLRDRL